MSDKLCKMYDRKKLKLHCASNQMKRKNKKNIDQYIKMLNIEMFVHAKFSLDSDTFTSFMR